MKVYLINIINTAGYSDGTESRQIAARNASAVIGVAHADYEKTFNTCLEEGILDTECELFTLDEFENEMRKAFERTHYAGYVYIQCLEHHIQYEATTLEV